MRILHLADIHIQNFNYLTELKEVFKTLYKQIKTQNVDAIVIAGDLFESKTDLSPESFFTASNFLRNLSKIAPVYITRGNHDFNVKSMDRLDGITSVINALKLKNIYYIRESQEVDLKNNFSLIVNSHKDRENWIIQPSDSKKINICVMHETISGVKTDIPNIELKSELGIEFFKPFDYAMLGHIHLFNQKMDKAGRYRYSGSIAQQSFSDASIDRGYLIWDIKSKKDFIVEAHTIKNKSPFVTITIDPTEDVKKQINAFKKENEVPEKSSIIRVDFSKDASYKNKEDIKQAIMKKFKTKKIKEKLGKKKDVSTELNTSKVNIEDRQTRKEYVKKYMEEVLEISDEQKIKDIIDLDIKFDDLIDSVKEDTRHFGITWSLKKIKWSNLFKYGEDNEVNFENLNDRVVGVLGKNYLGKSSLIDIITYGLFGKTTRRLLSNADIINFAKEKGIVEIWLEVDNEDYYIKREITKKVNKKTKKVSSESTLDFSKDGVSLNAVKNTDNEITKYIGHFEDFCLTNLKSQDDKINFVEAISSQRRHFLLNFLNLNTFEDKLKIAKEELKAVKKLKKLSESENYEESLTDLTGLFEVETKNIKTLEEKNNSLLEEINQRKEDLKEKEIKYSSILQKINSIIEMNDLLEDDLENSKYNIKSTYAKIEETKNSLKAELKALQQEKEEKEEIIKNINVGNVKQIIEKKAIFNKQLEEIEFKELKINNIEKKIISKENDLKVLKKVPCLNKEVKENCLFLTNILKEKERREILFTEITELKTKYSNLKEKLIEVDETLLGKHSDLQNKQKEVSYNIKNTSNKIKEVESEIAVLSKVPCNEQQQSTCLLVKNLFSKKSKMPTANRILINLEAEKKDIDVELENLDIEKTKKDIDTNESIKKELSSTKAIILTKKEEFLKIDISKLDNYPCRNNTDISSCEFLKDVFKIEQEVKTLNIDVKNEQNNMQDKTKIKNTINEFNEEISLCNTKIEKQMNLEKQISSIESNISSIAFKQEKVNLKKEDVNKQEKHLEDLEKITPEKNIYTSNINSLNNAIEKLEIEKRNSQEIIDEKKEKIIELSSKIKFVNSKLQERADVLIKFDLYNNYAKIFDEKGIISYILEENIPVINFEMNRILEACNFDFSLEMFNKDKNLSLLIVRPYDKEKRPIELGSGSEKAIANIIVRLALTNISLLPNINFIILDEPATELDSNNMERFIDVLNLMKENFKTVLLISHLDVLKNSVDEVIEIVDDKPFSKLVYV